MGHARVVPIILLVAAAVAPAVGAYSWCGDEYGVELRFHNPDLNPWNDPVPDDVPIENDPEIVEGSWHVFIQFQAVVDENHNVANEMDLLEEIESFWFGFGPVKELAVAEPLDNCDKPWAPGVQLYSSFSDTDPDDGFHIGLNTTLVPDGDYGAIVYACTDTSEQECKPDGDDDLVAAGWSRVRIYNGEDACTGAVNEYRCQRQHDFVEPWPRILPGDGNQTHTDLCDDPKRCLTIEFSEDVQQLDLTVNGVNRSDEVEPVELESDDPTSVLGYSEMYRWTAPRAFQRHDEIRVRAVDGAGNVAEKTISFRDESRGAAIPRIDAEIDVTAEPPTRKIQPDDAKTFRIQLTNQGNDTAHVFPTVEAPPTVEAEIGNDHIDVEGGRTATVLLEAGPTANASEGDHPVEVVFDYISGNRRRTAKAFPTVVADEDAALSGDAETDDGSVRPLGGGFSRRCQAEGRYRVCFLHPEDLAANGTFPFEVQTAIAADDQERRHEVDAGPGKLTLRYLTADGETAAPETSHEMTQVSTGQYRANVSLAELAPRIDAAFVSDRVETEVTIRETVETSSGSAKLPGFTWVAVLAVGVAAATLRRRP